MARTTLASAALLLILLSFDAGAYGAPPPGTAGAAMSGRGGEYSWTVSASRGAAGPQRSRPCMRVSITHHHGAFSYARSRFRGCLTAAAIRGRSAAPLLVGGTHLANPGDPSMSVFAVLASQSARRVRISSPDLPEGGGVTAALLPLGNSPFGLGGMRLALIAIPGVHCVERVSLRGAGPESLWASFLEDGGCPSGRASGE